MKKTIALYIIMLCAIKTMAQQDTQMSQHIFNGIFINPAYTGYKEDVYVQSYFRSQWMGLAGAPQSFSIAADGALENANIGLGAMITADRVGAQNSLSGYVNYAYRIAVGNDETSHIAFGLAAGIEQLGIDGSKLNALQAGDPSVPLTSQSMTVPDANIGFFYSSPTNFVGISATNLVARYIKNTNNNILVPIPQPHIYLTAGTLLDVAEGMKLKPVFLIKDDFKGPTTLDLDASVIYDGGLSLGAFYRNSIKLYSKNNLQQNIYAKQNAFGAMVEFFVTPSMRVGYSYDHDLNALGTYNYGSHELSVGFYLNSVRSNNSALRCYKF